MASAEPFAGVYVFGRLCGPMRLRLYHHSDGARVAYRESGADLPWCCCTQSV